MTHSPSAPVLCVVCCKLATVYIMCIHGLCTIIFATLCHPFDHHIRKIHPGPPDKCQLWVWERRPSLGTLLFTIINSRLGLTAKSKTENQFNIVQLSQVIEGSAFKPHTPSVAKCSPVYYWGSGWEAFIRAPTQNPRKQLSSVRLPILSWFSQSWRSFHQGKLAARGCPTLLMDPMDLARQKGQKALSMAVGEAQALAGLRPVQGLRLTVSTKSCKMKCQSGILEPGSSAFFYT